MRKLRLVVVIAALLVSLLLPMQFVGAIASPTSIQSNGVYVFTDCIEDGDIGVFVDYTIEYGTIPTETTTDSFLITFVDTDGTTHLRSVSPYPYIPSTKNGYGRGCAWIYFTASEVTAYSIDVADVALYSVKIMGNPLVPSGWSGDPPETTTYIDFWQTSGTAAVLVAVRVLQQADLIAVSWGMELTESTASGSKLNADGEAYFTNAIPYLRIIAPSVFISSQLQTVGGVLDLSTSFGATLAEGTGHATGAPITFASGSTTVTVPAGGAGTLILTLNNGTYGTATGAIVTGSPVTIGPGTNTINVTGAGTFVVAVALQNTQSKIDSTVTGTAFDMSALATIFQMDTALFSGLVWLLMTILICAATLRVSTRGQDGIPETPGKITLVVFDLCIIGGAVLGLIPVLIAALLFIAFGAFTGYVLFFRSANI